MTKLQTVWQAVCIESATGQYAEAWAEKDPKKAPEETPSPAKKKRKSPEAVRTCAKPETMPKISLVRWMAAQISAWSLLQVISYFSCLHMCSPCVSSHLLLF